MLSMCLLILFTTQAWASAAAPLAFPWVSGTAAEDQQVHLYFFWSERCPHCATARPFIEQLPERYPWLVLHSHELNRDRGARQLYHELATGLGQEARSVPAFIFCQQMYVGFDSAAATGRELSERLEYCHRQARGEVTAQPGAAIDTWVRVPLIGRFETREASLPMLTLVLAGLDSFNPCAFFVLLFLLSLLVHARSRARMAVVGMTFVLLSGLVYFLFMAAWLNVFLLFGKMTWITSVAGLLAIVLALINIKDFAYFRRGVSLSIPARAKPGLYQRMRNLIGADNLFTLLAGTTALAIAANSYELLCTAGFPMIYTRTLTLHGLSESSYYGYLLLYNAIYILPLLAIVVLFTLTLGARKLTEREGRALKLLSGLMMLELGFILVVYPQALNHPLAAAALLLVAVIVTYLATRILNRNSRD
ncbi:MAG: hypothetical protein AMJ69_04595 [Gammaproteobacteria bacterium SG8_47]|nr:MAG: hypothetical protein AMJ69_04595 [Gammaproteobacteria bacterium SG8_47]